VVGEKGEEEEIGVYDRWGQVVIGGKEKGRGCWAGWAAVVELPSWASCSLMFGPVLVVKLLQIV
jgi:hypothetical protein